MLNERFMGDIPDELDTDDDDALKAHKDLRRQVGDLQRRRQEVFDKHQLVLPQDDPTMIAVRLQLLIKFMFGNVSENRMLYELSWVQVYRNNIEHSLSEHLQMQRAMHLQMPDGSAHIIKPKNNGG